MAAWTFIALYLFRHLVIGHITKYSGELVPLHLMFLNNLEVMVILLPLALLSGACFPLATRIIDPRSEEAQGGLIAKAYTWNTAGAVAGSLLAGFAIAPSFDYFDSLYLLMFFYGATATVATLVILPTEWPPRVNLPAMIVLGLFSLILTGTGAAIVLRSNGYAASTGMASSRKVVFHKPGLQGITTVLQRRDESLADILLVNGMGMTVKVTDTKMMAHLPMIIHPDPKDTLVICFGMGTTYRSAISYGGNVMVVELVKEVMEAFDYFYEDSARVRAYARGRMVVDDGRNFLKLTRNKFDVITLDPPPPIDGAGVNNLYSKEFIELAKARLKKGGVMAHWIPFPYTMSGVDDEETFNMLVQTFMAVFPYVGMKRGYHDVGLHVLGFTEPPDLSMALVRQRLSQKEISGDLNEWDFVPLSYFENLRVFKSTVGRYPLVTDDRPRLEFYFLRTFLEGGKKTYAYNYWGRSLK
jgi:spermidine synthase